MKNKRTCNKCGSENITQTYSGETVVKKGQATSEIASPLFKCKDCENVFFED